MMKQSISGRGVDISEHLYQYVALKKSLVNFRNWSDPLCQRGFIDVDVDEL